MTDTVVIQETEVTAEVAGCDVTAVVSVTNVGVAITENNVIATISGDSVHTVVDESVVHAVVAGIQGPPGVASDGSAAEFCTAGESISALKPIVVIAGLGYIASNANASHRGFCAGVSISSCSQGNQFTIQNSGILQDSAWNWDVSKPWLFYGNGILTQVPPAGWSQPIARVESSDTIFIDIKQGIERQ